MSLFGFHFYWILWCLQYFVFRLFFFFSCRCLKQGYDDISARWWGNFSLWKISTLNKKIVMYYFGKYLVGCLWHRAQHPHSHMHMYTYVNVSGSELLWMSSFIRFTFRIYRMDSCLISLSQLIFWWNLQLLMCFPCDSNAKKYLYLYSAHRLESDLCAWFNVIILMGYLLLRWM